jgi:hypothetical protein
MLCGFLARFLVDKFQNIYKIIGVTRTSLGSGPRSMSKRDLKQRLYFEI